MCLAGFYPPTPDVLFCELCQPGSYSVNATKVLCLMCGTARHLQSTILELDYSTVKCILSMFISIAMIDLLSLSSLFPPLSPHNLFHFYPCLRIPTLSPSPSSYLTIRLARLRAQVCFPCETGRYVDTAGQTRCLNCPIGTHADVTGLYRCKLCAPGTFGKDTGRVTCEACAFGLNTYTAGKTACDTCRAGTYSGGGFSTVRRIFCGVCVLIFLSAHLLLYWSPTFPLYTYSPLTAPRVVIIARQCLPCAAGTQSPPGQVQCNRCEPGLYAPSKYQPTCSLCGDAQWAPNRSATACLNCAPGFKGSGQVRCGEIGVCFARVLLILLRVSHTLCRCMP